MLLAPVAPYFSLLRIHARNLLQQVWDYAGAV